MTLSDIKTMKKNRGFTIVELLIVIVVIGILVAIVIVAYSGVTNKANQSAAKGNASAVQKVVEAYNADKGTYPADAAAIAAATGLTAKVPGNVTVDTTVPTGTDPDKKGAHIFYKANAASDGGCVAYWDVLKSGGAGVVIIATGVAAGTLSGTTCS